MSKGAEFYKRKEEVEEILELIKIEKRQRKNAEDAKRKKEYAKEMKQFGTYAFIVSCLMIILFGFSVIIEAPSSDVWLFLCILSIPMSVIGFSAFFNTC